MEEDKKLPPIVMTLILTVITSFFWIFFSVYRSLTTKPEPVVPAEILFPLNPKLDLNTIEAIKTRIFIDDVPETYSPNLEIVPESETEEVETEDVVDEEETATGEAEVENEVEGSL